MERKCVICGSLLYQVPKSVFLRSQWLENLRTVCTAEQSVRFATGGYISVCADHFCDSSSRVVVYDTSICADVELTNSDKMLMMDVTETEPRSDHDYAKSARTVEVEESEIINALRRKWQRCKTQCNRARLQAQKLSEELVDLSRRLPSNCEIQQQQS